MAFSTHHDHIPNSTKEMFSFATLDFSNTNSISWRNTPSAVFWCTSHYFHTILAFCTASCFWMRGGGCDSVFPALRGCVEGRVFTLEFGKRVVMFSVHHFPAWCQMGLTILRKHQHVVICVAVNWGPHVCFQNPRLLQQRETAETHWSCSTIFK